MDGWMDGWMDGYTWMDTDGWMDGWMTNITKFDLNFPFSKCNKQLHFNYISINLNYVY